MSDKQSKPLKKKKIVEKAPIAAPADKSSPAAPVTAAPARKK